MTITQEMPIPEELQKGYDACETVISSHERIFFEYGQPFTVEKITDSAQTVASSEKYHMAAGRTHERGKFEQKQKQYESDYFMPSEKELGEIKDLLARLKAAADSANHVLGARKAEELLSRCGKCLSHIKELRRVVKKVGRDYGVAVDSGNSSQDPAISSIGVTDYIPKKEPVKTQVQMEIELNTSLVPYRETINGKADVRGKFVKQTGGDAQYGIVDMKFEPSGDIEAPYILDITVEGGNVPKQYYPAVEKGMLESVKAGPLAGYPVVGVRANLYDGKYHAVDSSEQAFKMAAQIAFENGFMQAKPTILEPIMKVTVLVPDDFTGYIMGDMNKRRGRILGMEKEGSEQKILAEVPQSEMLKYPIDLRSMTQGRGSFTMTFERYDEAPSDVQAKIIAARKEQLEAMKNEG